MSENLRYTLAFIVIFSCIGWFAIQAASLGFSRAWNVVGSQIEMVAK